ncbi:putative adipose-regulatory protein (Seipin) domain containing protein [Naviculisporaceae sp. PSN 640]
MSGSGSDTSSKDARKEEPRYGIARIPSILTELILDALQDILAILRNQWVQKTFIYGTVLAITGILLFVPAVVAYFSFWSRYLPDQITTVPVHLQYGYGVNPWGVSYLPKSRLKNYQAYDITVSLTLPMSPANLDRGNFMVALHLLSEDKQASEQQQKKKNAQQQIESPPYPPLPTSSFEVNPEGKISLPVRRDPSYYFTSKKVLGTSTRPTLVPYQDPLVSLASRIFWLPYYVFVNPPKSETTQLQISLMEKVYFGKDIPLPTEVFVEVQAGQNLQVYRASATFTAQLEGMRWFMAYHSWIAFVVFTSFFWGCEMVVLAGTWGAVWVLLRILGITGTSQDKEKSAVVKVEPGEVQGRKKSENEDGLSDTERTFPSLSGQPPLKFEGRIKQEEGEPQGIAPDIPLAGEADDEDNGEEEEEDGRAHRDSGIGTSYDDNVAREGFKRRTSGSRSRRA